MIVSALLDLIYNVISTLLSIIDLPDLPDTAKSYIEQFKGILSDGVAIFGVYFDLQYIKILFTIFITVTLAIEVYHLVMWVIKKIPMLGIK